MKAKFNEAIRNNVITTCNRCTMINGWAILITIDFEVTYSEKYPGVLGLCEDGNPCAVCILNKESNKIEEIECRRLIGFICDEYLTGVFSEEEINEICEIFACDFKEYAKKWA